MVNERWLYPKDVREAIQVQKEMAACVSFSDLKKDPQVIGGLDVSSTPFSSSKEIFGAAVLLSFPSCQVIEKKEAKMDQGFPYIPGLLGFREAPVLIKAFQALSQRPDLLFIDGHGISHPRGLGIASHIGILLDIPTIGVAKSILIGTLHTSLPEEVGSQVPLMWKGKVVGMALRTKKRCLPLIISPGHKMSLEKSIQWVLKSLKGYRLPEPIRQAHLAANAIRRSCV